MKKILVKIDTKEANLKAISEHSEEYNDQSPGGSYKSGKKSLNGDEHEGVEQSNAFNFQEEEQKGEKQKFCIEMAADKNLNDVSD